MDRETERQPAPLCTFRKNDGKQCGRRTRHASGRCFQHRGYSLRFVLSSALVAALITSVIPAVEYYENKTQPDPIIVAISPDLLFPNTTATVYGKGFNNQPRDGFLLIRRHRLAVGDTISWQEDAVEFRLPDELKPGLATLILDNGTKADAFTVEISTAQTHPEWLHVLFAGVQIHGTSDNGLVADSQRIETILREWQSSPSDCQVFVDILSDDFRFPDHALADRVALHGADLGLTISLERKSKGSDVSVQFGFVSHPTFSLPTVEPEHRQRFSFPLTERGQTGAATLPLEVPTLGASGKRRVTITQSVMRKEADTSDVSDALSNLLRFLCRVKPYARGEWERAAETLLEGEPSAIELYFAGVALHRIGQKRRAVAAISLAIQKAGVGQPDMLADKAWTLLDGDESPTTLNEALDLFDSALRERSDFWNAHYGRSFALYRLQRPAEAMAPAEEAVRLHRSAMTLTLLAGLRLAHGHLDEAEVLQREVVELDPMNWLAKYNLAGLLYRNQKFDEALRAYDQLLAAPPQDDKKKLYVHNAYLMRGNTHMDLGLWQEACDDADTLLALDPTNEDAMYNRGLCLIELTRVEEAADVYLRLSRIRPEDAEVRLQLAITLVILERVNAAMNELSTALRIDPRLRQRTLREPRLAALRNHENWESVVGSNGSMDKE